MKTFLKYFLTFVSGIIFSIVAFVLLVVILLSQIDFKPKTTAYSESTILKIDLPLTLKEHSSDAGINGLFQSLSGSNELTMSQICRSIKSASRDPKIKAIELNPGLYSGGMAMAEEIRNALDTFKKSGKQVWCYSENYSENSFLIASKAHKIFANPKGVAEFNGFSSGIVMYKGMLDKLGVDVQVFKVGKFKGAVEPFSEKTLSEGNQEQIRSYLNDLFELQLEKIAQDRKITKTQLRDFAQTGNSYHIKECQKKGLIDDLIYYDEFDDFLKKKYGKFDKLGLADYAKNSEEYYYSENKIAVLFLEGEIVSGKNENGDQIASENVCKQLKKLRENEEVKAIVLRINSPGGSSVASDIIAREVEITKKKKTVIVSFGNVAASGGYYIGCVGDSIFADPKTITGSIGVFALIPNTKKLYEHTLGLGYETVSTSPNAELWRPDKPLTELQKQMIQSMIDHVYDDFTQIVSKGRKLPLEKVEQLAQGKVYSGLSAQKNGLIDGFGGLDYCIAAAAKKSKLKDFRVAHYPEPEDPFEQFMKLFNAKVRIKTHMSHPVVSELLQTTQQWNSLMGIQTRLPWSTNIQ